MKGIDPLLQPDSVLFSQNKPDKISSDKGDVNSLTVSFSDVIKGMLKNTNDLQMESSELTRKLVIGEIDNVHDVMIAAQKAGMALDFTVEIKNQLVRALQSLERMQ